MPVVNVVQGSPEWLFERMGNCTASRAADAISFLKRGDKKGTESEARRKYRLELIAERISGKLTDHYVSGPMEDGIANEPLAKAAYEVEFDCDVENVGMVTHPTIKGFSCSPDGFIGNDGMLQIKCPLPHTHLSYILGGDIPADYETQMRAELSCCPERTYSDFVSYCGVFPRGFRLFVKRMERDSAKIAELESGVIVFLEELELAFRDLLLSRNADLTQILKESVDNARAGLQSQGNSCITSYPGIIP